MKRVYSTDDLQNAKDVAERLERAGIATYVSGENVARTPGVTPRVLRDAIGVWVLNDTQLDEATQVVQQYTPAPKPRKTPNPETTFPSQPAWVRWTAIITAIALLLALAL